jgi:hypothetical protein
MTLQGKKLMGNSIAENLIGMRKGEKNLNLAIRGLD